MTVNQTLRRAKRLHGRSIAIHHEDKQITYEELHATVEASARKLVTLGVSKGDRVAVLMQNCPEYLDLYYSVPLAGGIIVPLNTRWHINEIVYTLADSGSKLLFIDERYAPLAAEIRAGAKALEQVVFIGTAKCPSGLIDWRTADPSMSGSFEEPHEDDVTGLFYTSGTTGGPKGAMLTHRNLYTQALHSMLPPLGFPPGWRFLHAAPMFHLADAGAIHGLTLAG